MPSMDGELRDFPNAVSLYSEKNGAQDSLEYYPIPDNELGKYRIDGAGSYHANFVRESLIDKRYREHFKNLSIVSEKLHTVEGNPLYLTTLSLPGGSQLVDDNNRRRDLWVTLGTLVSGDRIFIYQRAVTDLGDTDKEQLVQEMTERIVHWASETTYGS